MSKTFYCKHVIAGMLLARNNSSWCTFVVRDICYRWQALVSITYSNFIPYTWPNHIALYCIPSDFKVYKLNMILLSTHPQLHYLDKISETTLPNEVKCLLHFHYHLGNLLFCQVEGKTSVKVVTNRAILWSIFWAPESISDCVS